VDQCEVQGPGRSKVSWDSLRVGARERVRSFIGKGIEYLLVQVVKLFFKDDCLLPGRVGMSHVMKYVL
jgi:hypothetical protein